MNGRLAVLLVALLAACMCAPARAATTDDLVFIHHSCGEDWLDRGLHNALLAKSYIDERNDITYGTDMPPDAGRPDSLASTPGDNTNMNHWIRWFNDYLEGVKAHGCADGENKIIMFKSCYPANNIGSDGTEPGDPFDSSQTTANYKAVFQHPNGPGHTYTRGGHTYRPLEDIFAGNPNTLFIYVASPPCHYAPEDGTDDDEAHRARLFYAWVKGQWLNSYNTAHPGLNNVAVFDWFDLLAYPDNHPDHPNRLRAEYGGTTGDSHPNEAADIYTTQVFATNPTNFIDTAWNAFSTAAPATVCVDAANTTGVEDGSTEHPYTTIQAAIDAVPDGGTVKVARDTYRENIVVVGKSVTIQGGYPGGTAYPAPGDFDDGNRDPNPASNNTVIDGGGSAVLCQGGGSPASQLVGFTIRNRGATCRGGFVLRQVIASSSQ